MERKAQLGDRHRTQRMERTDEGCLNKINVAEKGNQKQRLREVERETQRNEKKEKYKGETQRDAQRPEEDQKELRHCQKVQGRQQKKGKTYTNYRKVKEERKNKQPKAKRN